MGGDLWMKLEMEGLLWGVSCCGKMETKRAI